VFRSRGLFRLGISPHREEQTPAQKIGKELTDAHARHLLTNTAARIFTHFHYRTLKSWSRQRRVIAKAEQLRNKSNPNATRLQKW